MKLFRHWPLRRAQQDRVAAAVRETARRNAELRRLVEQIKRTHNVREAKP